MKKDNIYGWIILFVCLIPLCIMSAVGINKFLMFMTETPMYTNIFRYDTIDMRVNLPESWHFKENEDCFYLTNNSETENLYITTVESATSMDVAKDMFMLSFNDSYTGTRNYEEGTIDGLTKVYYIRYSEYSNYYVTGVLENNGIFANFSYQTSLTNSNMSPLSTILSSIRLSKVVDTIESSKTN